VFPLKEPADTARRTSECSNWFTGPTAGSPRWAASIRPTTPHAVRCLDAGAAGVKLHPLGEGFALDDRRLDDVFALADEHAGR
jgi:hypothetical protein